MRILLLILLTFSHARADMLFDGVDDFIECNSTTFTNAGTIALRVKLTALAAAVFTGNQDTSGSANYMQLYIHTDGTVNFYNIAGEAVTATSTIATGTEYHIAITSTGSALACYINGAAVTFTPTGTAGVWFSDVTGINQYVIGALKRGPSTEIFSPTNGIIRDVRLYDRALSATEVASLAAGKLKYDSNTSGLIAYWPLDDQPNGTSGDGDTYRDRAGASPGTGVDGANNANLTNQASAVMSYP